MTSVSGQLIFDRNRSKRVEAGDVGIANIPIVLQNRSTGARITASTDTNGNYRFTNVPNGNYRIVEAYGQPAGANPADFSQAIVGPVPTGMDPPISFVPTAPTGATHLDSITPNTLLVIVEGTDLINQNFLDGPVRYTPIQTLLDSCSNIDGPNLITAADNGTFGRESAGSPANSGPQTAPYVGIAPGFNYIPPSQNIVDGSYTIVNIVYPPPLYRWWILANHTNGIETGRFQLINGSNPDEVFFRQRVPVIPNKNYLFSTWIANLDNDISLEPPSLGLQILGENGQVLYNETLGDDIPVRTDFPEWKQIGTILNTQENSLIEVRFVSEAPAEDGNDYAIDDVTLNLIEVPVFKPVKSVFPVTANVGEKVTYTISLTNTCQSDLTSIVLTDSLPDGVTFRTGSVTINGAPLTVANPERGISIPNLSGGNTVVITFEADVTSLPSINPVSNSATIAYDYTPVQGGILNRYTQSSNPAILQITEQADIGITKAASPNPIVAGETITYTLSISNAGPSPAREVVVEDAISSSILNPQYSMNGGAIWQDWTGKVNVGTIVSGETQTIWIRGKISDEATGNILNRAIVSTKTPNINPGNTTASVRTFVAQIEIEKNASVRETIVGESYTYSLTIRNTGEVVVPHVVVMDRLPAALTYKGNLRRNGSSIIGDLTQGIDLGNIEIGETILLTFDVEVASQPAHLRIDNTFTVQYLGKTQESEPISVNVYNPSIRVSKQASQENISLAEPFYYMIQLINSGDIDLYNIEVMDSLPPGFNVQRIILDGSTLSGNIRTGISVGSLQIGQIKTIQLNIVLDEDIALETYRNTAIATGQAFIGSENPPIIVTGRGRDSVGIRPFNPALKIQKQADKSCITVCEWITFTIRVRNNGNVMLRNLMLFDELPNELSFICGSVMLNGTPKPYLDITQGIGLGNLEAEEQVFITFMAQLDYRCGCFISNSAKVRYSYVFADNTLETRMLESNEIKIRTL